MNKMKTTLTVKPAHYIALMCLVLFSFSPCAIKNSLIDTTVFDLQKNLNKNSATNLTCQITTSTSNKIYVVKKKEDKETAVQFSFLGNQQNEANTVHLPFYYNPNYSANSPPKYILYQRLKIALA